MCSVLMMCSSLFTQGHKYVVQAEVLYKSWDFDESQLAFAHTLQEMEKNELRGICIDQNYLTHGITQRNASTVSHH